MFVVNEKTELSKGFRVLCENSGSVSETDFMYVKELPTYCVTNGATIRFHLCDSSVGTACLDLSPETARRFAETLNRFLDTLDTLDKQV